MAFGGRSIGKTSEETFDFVCTDCADDNRIVEAVKYCIDCSGYCCQQCMDTHNRMRSLKHHNLMDVNQGQTGDQSSRLPEFPTERCRDHAGKVMDMYCQGHDVIGCTVCFVKDHSSCDRSLIHSIPDMIDTLFNPSESNLVKSLLKYTVVSIDTVSQSKDTQLQKLIKTKNTALGKVDAFQKLLERILKSAGQSTRNEVMRIFNQLKTGILDDKNDTDNISEDLKTSVNKLNQCEGNRAQRFACTKDAQRKIKQAADVKVKHEMSADGTDVNIEFIPDSSLMEFIKALHGIGHVTQYDRSTRGSANKEQTNDGATKHNVSNQGENNRDQSKQEDIILDQSEKGEAKCDQSGQGAEKGDQSKRGAEKCDQSGQGAEKGDQSELRAERGDQSNQGDMKHDQSELGAVQGDQSNQGDTKHDQSEPGAVHGNQSNQGDTKQDQSEQGAVKGDQSKQGDTKHDRSEQGVVKGDQSKQGDTKHDQSKQGAVKSDPSKQRDTGHDQSEQGAEEGDQSKSGETELDQPKQGTTICDQSDQQTPNRDQSGQGKPNHDGLYKIKTRSEINIKLSDDSKTCDSFGCCLTEDNKLIVTDNNNMKLKRINIPNMTVEAYCLLDSYPRGVCSISVNEVAVACGSSKKIQFVTVDNRMTPTRQLSMKHSCYGIACKNGKLYVTDWSKSLHIYDLQGTLLSQISNDNTGNQLFDLSHHVAVNDRGSRVFVGGGGKGLVCLDGMGKHILSIQDADIGYAIGVCLDDVGNVFVTGYSNVVQYEENGQKVGVVVETEDGLSSGAWSVFYHPGLHKLFVTMINSDVVKVYELE